MRDRIMPADEYTGILQILAAGAFVFAALLALRLTTGNRPVAQMGVFEVVILVAMCLTLTAILLWESVSPAEGVLAFGALLVLLQLSMWRRERKNS